MNRYKRFFLVLLLCFTLSDICSYIKLFLEKDGLKVEGFYLYVTKFNDGEPMYNLGIIFILISGLVSLLISLLKRND